MTAILNVVLDSLKDPRNCRGAFSMLFYSYSRCYTERLRLAARQAALKSQILADRQWRDSRTAWTGVSNFGRDLEL